VQSTFHQEAGFNLVGIDGRQRVGFAACAED
jgi:hypothetical protein